MDEITGTKKTSYLAEYPKKFVDITLKHINTKTAKMKINDLFDITVNGKTVTVSIAETKLTEATQLDSCHIFKSNVTKNVVVKETSHKRYRDLVMVEYAFRTMIQSFEQMQRIYVRKECCIHGHVFV